MALTADDLRRQAVSSKMKSLYGGTSNRVSSGRVAPPPSGTPALEQQAPSMVADVGTAIGAGTAIASTALGAINPLLGMFVGALGGMASDFATTEIADAEAAQAAQVQHRNRRALGQAQLEQQQYEQSLANRRPQTPPQSSMMPVAPIDPQQVAPGAIDRQRSLLLS